MTIEGANKFIGRDKDGLLKLCLSKAINIDWLASKFTDFATQEVKAERERIANELEVVLGGSLNYRIADVERFIDQLRNGGTE